jgi:hypothetical protein
MAMVACATVALAGCASSPETHPAPTAGVSALPSASTSPLGGQSPSPTSSTDTGAGPSLVALADGGDGTPALWTLTGTTWALAARVPGVSAMSRSGQEIALASSRAVQFRQLSAPLQAWKEVALTWPAGVTPAPPTGLDGSSSGPDVIAFQQGEDLLFCVTDAGGSLHPISPRPSSPFGPSAAWLDRTRLLLLSSDSQQISHLTVVDVKATAAYRQLGNLGGVRIFAASPDRRLVAAATESSVYVGETAQWLADAAPVPAIALGSGHVVWGLALSGDDSRLAMLSGTVSADGTVTSVQDLIYSLTGGTWREMAAVSVPFAQATNQVWLT